jgi:hypothetical protein
MEYRERSSITDNKPRTDRHIKLAASILTFCSDGKTEEKILREFGKAAEAQVKQTFRSLANQGKLKVVNKGAKVLFQAAR